MELVLLENGNYEFNGTEYSKKELAYMISNDVFIQKAKEYGGIIEINTDNLISTINRERYGVIQKIIFGPPGTGKSYKVNNIIRESYPDYNPSIGNSEFVFRTAIHPNFDYTEFVGNVMPIVEEDGDNKNIIYDFKPGVFTRSLYKAFQTNNDVYLILEEMSRGNIAEIFGDLFQLLDRDTNDKSSYSISNDLIADFIQSEFNKISQPTPITEDNIYLPSNFHIIGTVNTSDQNVYVMDTAFKRRFEMEYMDLKPKKNKNGNFFNNYKIELHNVDLDWIEFYQKINRFITDKLKMREDKQLGQFFLKFKFEEEYNFDELSSNEDKIESLRKYIKNWNKKQYQDKLMMYLWHDVHKATIISEYTLFNSRYKSIGDLLEGIKLGEDIFSDDFYSYLE